MKFNPRIYQCTECDTKLQSSFEGQFVRCECGQSFVDQTRHYERRGGSAMSLEALLEAEFYSIAKIDEVMESFKQDLDKGDKNDN